MTELTTSLTDLRLITPDVGRDAPASVKWLSGEIGRQTLRLMGNAEADYQPPTLHAEQERIKDFLNSEEQLTWTISYHGKPVGAVWTNLTPTEYLPAPSLHIMIGDPEVRGKGLGTASMQAMIRHLQDTLGYAELYSRFLLENTGSKRLLTDLGFQELAEPYQDARGLTFQNVRLAQ